MALDTQINRQVLISIYPDLHGDVNFKILSDITPIYNCIAWAMGYTDRWVDHVILPGHWWPDNVIRENSSAALKEAFEAEGFIEADDYLPEEGYEKVILYKNADTDEWTHASRIITKDIEYSKFGETWDAQHSHDVLCHTSDGYEMCSYGVAYTYMKRKCAQPPTAINGTINVDRDKVAKLKMMLRMPLSHH